MTRIIACCLRSLLLALAILLAGVGLAQEVGTFVRVSVERASVRAGPSIEHQLLGWVYEHDPLQVVRRDGSWLKVRDFEGQQRWIYAPLTDRRPSVIVIVRIANVRAGPGTDHPIVFTAERGVSFLVLERRGDWLHVQHADEDEGWISGALIWGAIE